MPNRTQAIGEIYRQNHNVSLLDSGTQALYPSTLSVQESRTVQKALKILESKSLSVAPVLAYFGHFDRYLRLRFAGLTNEQFHVLYLDINNRLLSAETEVCGYQSGCTVEIRPIALREMVLGAESVVFAHNHPGGIPEPSDADVSHLTHAERALSALNVSVLDSFVVTAKGITSIKAYRDQAKALKEREWLAEWERIKAERKAKRAAAKAAKLAQSTELQLQGA